VIQFVNGHGRKDLVVEAARKTSPGKRKRL